MHAPFPHSRPDPHRLAMDLVTASRAEKTSSCAGMSQKTIANIAAAIQDSPVPPQEMIRRIAEALAEIPRRARYSTELAEHSATALDLLQKLAAEVLRLRGPSEPEQISSHL